ncbi:hypothetical protein [Henriciella aquimarina]|uniref:hypothetical protein n=1 Tax=Henriciella aquimarina TaxID=545261 RepID=UPI000A02BF19|nr:hypothetical protein [Henriciella aquimarina]
MSDHTSLETFRQAFADFSDKTVSVYVPRPAIEIGGEKWRILRKNVIDEVKDHAPQADFILERLENFELPDFRANGIALFDDGKNRRMAHLNARPVASITTGQPPFILPLLADFQSRETHWVLFITRGEPKLFLYSGGHVKDMSDRLDAPKYRSVEARRHVHDDVFFHSVSRGSASNGDGESAYHALGTGQDEERDKTDRAFYEDVANAADLALPPQVKTLHIIGEEGTVGHFAKVMEHGRFDIEQHHVGGPNEVETHIQEVFGEQSAADDYLPEGKNLPDLQDAAKSGQLGTLYLPIEHAMLETMHEQADEHVKLRAFDGESEQTAENLTAVLALENGAEIHWYGAEEHDALPEMRADLRW